MAAVLAAQGIEVMLTREDDHFVSLEERTARANAFGADLFVSIHCNASEGRVRRVPLLKVGERIPNPVTTKKLVTNVLLVEDNPIDARLMHRAFMKLPNWPAQVTLIEDGQKALWYLQSLENGGVQEPPSVVLLDMNLPKYDGLQVLEAFRNSIVVWDMPVFLLQFRAAG